MSSKYKSFSHDSSSYSGFTYSLEARAAKLMIGLSPKDSVNKFRDKKLTKKKHLQGIL